MKRFLCATLVASIIAVLAGVSTVGGVSHSSANLPSVGADAGSIGEGSQRLVVEPKAGYEEEALAEIVAAGGSIRRVVQGVVDVSATDDVAHRLAELDAVNSIAPLAVAVSAAVDPSLSGANAFGGEGAAAVGVPSWRAAGLTGSKVRVGVIDSGFADWDRAVAAGELASNAVVARRNYCDQGFERSTHGTITSEILFDMAPEAELVLVCIDDALDLAQAIDMLLADGVQIVNMSLGFFNTSRGDGSGGPATPDDSVRRALGAGLTWVNSAGNEALVHNSGSFKDANGNGVHEFGAGDERMAFTVPTRGRVDIYLKWDQWGAVGDDFEACLSDSDTAQPRCFSSKVAERGLPTAAIGLTSPLDRPIELYLSIKRRSGRGLPRFDTFVVGASSIEYPVAEGSLVEPASAPGVVAVGAVCTSSGELRPYSSRGPVIDGRPGVSLAAPGSVSGFLTGPINGCDALNGGTSTAAPHAAGALALIRQGFPNYSGSNVVEELLARAERTIPSAQADPATGFGLLDLGVPPSGFEGPGEGGSGGVNPPATAEGFALALSSKPDRSGATVLSNPTLAGNAYIFVTPVFPVGGSVEQVRFFINGVLVQVEKLAGYDLGGGGRNQAFPFDTFRLANGRHRVRVDLRLTTGRVVSISAPFSVDNAATPAPKRLVELVAGPTGSLLEAQVLRSATPISLRLNDSALAVHHVLFYVDADLAGYDQYAPYQLSGGNGGGFDVSALGAGQHMAQAIVYLLDGRVLTANASFSVA